MIFQRILFICLCIIVLSACNTFYPEELGCKKYLNSDLGEAFAETNGNDYQSSAQFYLYEDTVSFSFTKHEQNCYFGRALYISNIIINHADTTYLSKPANSYFHNTKPTAKYSDWDYDYYREQHDLLQKDSLNNWVYIESINSDTTEIKGTFNFTLVDDSPYNGDSYGLLDTVYFQNGYFRAINGTH